MTFAKVTLTLTTRSNKRFLRYFKIIVLVTFSLEKISEHIKANLIQLLYTIIFHITAVCICN